MSGYILKMRESLKDCCSQIIKFYLLFFVGLLFSVHGQVIERFNGDRFTHYQPDDWISYAPALNITSIDMDDNFVYFASSGGGILRYNLFRNEWDFPFTTSTGLSSNTVYRIVYAAAEGRIYAQTAMGIDEYNFAERYWKPSNISRLPEQRQPSLDAVANLRPHENNRFPVYFRPPDRFLPDFFTGRDFLYRMDGIVIDRFNREFSFSDRLTDTWQRLWIGTDGLGVFVADLASVFLEPRSFSLASVSLRDSHFDGDDVWFGGFNSRDNIRTVSGITRWDLTRDNWEYFEAPLVTGLNSDQVSRIISDSLHVYFATDQGLVLFNRNSGRWRTISAVDGLSSNRLIDLQLHNSLLFIAGEFGVDIINTSDMELISGINPNLKQLRVNRFSADGKFLWLASRDGLYRYDPVRKVIEFIASRSSIPDYNPTAICVHDGIVWLASSYGISLFNVETNRWQSFPGFESGFLYRDIVANKQGIWFATDQGLLKYDSEAGYWRLFTKRDGLISNDIYSIDVDEDDLWISTSAGLTIFHSYRKGRLD
jgi:hypothetical protein